MEILTLGIGLASASAVVLGYLNTTTAKAEENTFGKRYRIARTRKKTESRFKSLAAQIEKKSISLE